MESGFCTTTGDVQLSGWAKKKLPKHSLKPNLYQKKILVLVWWSAASLILYSFLNPSETISSEKCAQQIVEMCRKLQLLQPALVNRLGPILLHGSAQPTLQKLNELGTKFCLIHRIHLTSRQSTITSSSISTTFCRQNVSTTSRRQKMLSKRWSNSEAGIFLL